MRSLHSNLITLTLSESLEKDRPKLISIIESAEKNIEEFARKNEWEQFIQQPFFDEVLIFDSKADFYSAVIELSNIHENMEFPEKFCGCLENRKLMAVSPELYKNIYPEGVEENGFQKLIEHEIAHRLHIRILHGNEDTMGPIWFYEGFAIIAADQFAETELDLSNEEMRSIMKNPKRISYIDYGFILRYLLQKVSLQKLVDQAGTQEFELWIHDLLFNLK